MIFIITVAIGLGLILIVQLTIIGLFLIQIRKRLDRIHRLVYHLLPNDRAVTYAENELRVGGRRLPVFKINIPRSKND